MNLFEATKKRPDNLEKLHHALITIKHKSMKPERTFNQATFDTKLRNRLMKVCFDCHASVL